MTRGQLLLALLAAIAVGAVAWAAGGSGGGDKNAGGPSGEPDAKTPANAVVVSFAYSPEKEKLLLPLIKEFNAKGRPRPRPPVRRHGPNRPPGEAESRIASGSLKPVAWSPAGSLW